jgi:hypothetical protein
MRDAQDKIDEAEEQKFHEQISKIETKMKHLCQSKLRNNMSSTNLA